MIQIDLQVKRLRSTATLPTKAHDTDLGYDLYSDDHAILFPNKVVKIPTGIACAFPVQQVIIPAYEIQTEAGSGIMSLKNSINVKKAIPFGALIRDRSSVATRLECIVVAGVIDHEYRGEIIVAMHNLTDNIVEIPAGSKIAQMILTPTYSFPITEVKEFSDETNRGSKGFGSSGV